MKCNVSLALFAVAVAACGTTLVGPVPIDGGQRQDAAQDLDATGPSDAAADRQLPVLPDGSAFCAAQAMRQSRCDAGAFDTNACLLNERCTDQGFRSEANALYQMCMNARACGVSNDSCIASTEATYGTISTDFRASCLSKRSACQDAGTSFLDDNCFTFGILTDDLRVQWAACVAKPCAEVNACFKSVVAALGCK
jgi:hypothetical protein